MNKIFAFASVIFIGLPAEAVGIGPVTVGGSYLGAHYAFDQGNRKENDHRRSRFDLAGNLDFNWKANERVHGLVQLQMGTDDGAEGTLGLGGRGSNQQVEVTDLFVKIQACDKPGITWTIGSFDTPFGEEVGFLSNNADIANNSMIQNSLFYAAYGGNMGTLNTLGIMSTLSAGIFDVTAAVTNGTDESANNRDGNYEFVASLGATPREGLRLAGSYVTSDDTEPSGFSGFGAKFEGWIAEARYAPFEGAGIKGYFGEMDFGDENPITRDDVRVWMGEVRYGMDRWHIAARVSGWDPDDADGSGAGMSAALPNPGRSITQGGIPVVTDQRVRRIQIGAGWQIYEGLDVRGEGFRDEYDRPSGGTSTDIDGFIVALSGRF